MPIAISVTELIGNTPRVRSNRLSRGRTAEVQLMDVIIPPFGERYLSAPRFAGLGD